MPDCSSFLGRPHLVTHHPPHITKLHQPPLLNTQLHTASSYTYSPRFFCSFSYSCTTPLGYSQHYSQLYAKLDILGSTSPEPFSEFGHMDSAHRDTSATSLVHSTSTFTKVYCSSNACDYSLVGRGPTSASCGRSGCKPALDLF